MFPFPYIRKKTKNKRLAWSKNSHRKLQNLLWGFQNRPTRTFLFALDAFKLLITPIKFNYTINIMLRAAVWYMRNCLKININYKSLLIDVIVWGTAKSKFICEIAIKNLIQITKSGNNFYVLLARVNVIYYITVPTPI